MRLVLHAYTGNHGVVTVTKAFKTFKTNRMERMCRECGKTLTGRSDKVFCEDTCRVSWHNRNRQEEERIFRPVWNTLKNNYHILRRMYHSPSPGRVSFRLMQHLGYDFTCHTACDPSGSVFCFDYGYRWFEGGQYLQIIHKDGFSTHL